jgi:hypothetical protein
VGHVDQTLARSSWVNICLIHIISKDGRHSNELGRERRGNSHEDDKESGDRTSAAKKGNSGVWNDKSSRDVSRKHASGIGWEDRIGFQSESS